MNINASIIDQMLSGIKKEIIDDAKKLGFMHDEPHLQSLGFVYLCVKTMLDLNFEENFDCLTDGGGDFGVDAIHIGEEIDGEFTIILFQGKYTFDLSKNSNFPENGIKALINAIRHIFDPHANLGNINERLKTKVEEVRSMIRDGFIPKVRAIACNNGLKWNEQAQNLIDLENFGDQVTWEHVNHDVIVNILQRVKHVNETLKLTGKAIIEDMNYSRVCIGRIPVTEIATLMKNHGENILERNIRRYLGLHGNRVNQAIKTTLISNDPTNFYFFNNGLTIVCDDFIYNGLQNDNYQVQVENLQIVNGGQTCMTIFKTIQELQDKNKQLLTSASVLVRIYKLPRNNEDIVLQITKATNSQNPVDLKDLQSNDAKQIQLEVDIKELGFTYRRKRQAETATKPTEITSGVAAAAILSVWREKPHQAKFLAREHFGKLYDVIFTDDLNGSQTIIAVLLYRIAENHRKRLAEDEQLFVRYASCFIAMQMGKHLLNDLNVNLRELDHKIFMKAHKLIIEKGEQYFRIAAEDIGKALNDLYKKQEISMQQLSATFRRGDLIQLLK